MFLVSTHNRAASFSSLIFVLLTRMFFLSLVPKLKLPNRLYDSENVRHSPPPVNRYFQQWMFVFKWKQTKVILSGKFVSLVHNSTYSRIKKTMFRTLETRYFDWLWELTNGNFKWKRPCVDLSKITPSFEEKKLTWIPT